MILRRVERSHVWSFIPSKDYIHNPWKSRRTALIVLRRIEGLCVILQPFQELWTQSFEGLKDCMQSFNPSKDCMMLWRVEGLQMQSFEGLKDHTRSFNPWKDCKEWLHNPSTIWMTLPMQWLEGLVEGSHSQWLEGLKDHVQSFNTSKDYKWNPSILRMIMNVILQPYECNTWKGWRITFMILPRVEESCVILQPFEGLMMSLVKSHVKMLLIITSKITDENISTIFMENFCVNGK